MAEARTDPGGLTHVPFFQAWGHSLAQAADGLTSDGDLSPGGGWIGSGAGGGFGAAMHDAPIGDSQVTTLGGSERGGGGAVFVPPGGPDDPGTTTGGPSTTTSGSTGDTGTTTGDTGTTTGTVTTRFTSGETTTDGPVDTDGEVPLVPEPATMTLLGLGALGVLMRARRLRR